MLTTLRGDTSVLTISSAVLLLVIVILLVRRSGLRPAHAVICVLLGFYLASTNSVGPSIENFTSGVSSMINSIRL